MIEKRSFPSEEQYHVPLLISFIFLLALRVVELALTTLSTLGELVNHQRRGSLATGTPSHSSATSTPPCLWGSSVSDMVFIPVERIFSSNVFVRKARERKPG